MKKFSKILIILIISFSVALKVNAASNPYAETTSWGATNCTWYAWKMAYERAGIALPSWGNAKDWANNARNAGFSVGSTPRGNSIAVWTNCDGVCGTYGHVGYVVSVGTDPELGEVAYMKDSGRMEDCVDRNDESFKACIAASQDESGDKACAAAAPKKACPVILANEGITSYIYLDNAPKVAPTTTAAPTTTTTKAKSNNATLSDIKIENVDFVFDKEKDNFEITVEEKIDKINIIATPADEASTINGDKGHVLKIGENEIIINVTAEDGTKKAYTLNITRNKKEVKTTKKINKKKVVKKSNKKLYYIVGISCVLIIGVIITLILLRKKKTQGRKTK